MLYRCSHRRKCGKRKSFTRKQLCSYKTDKPFRCECGGTFKPDTAQMEKNKESRCRCDAYPYPHRTGSKFCHEGEMKYTEDEYRDHMNNFFNKER